MTLNLSVGMKLRELIKEPKFIEVMLKIQFMIGMDEKSLRRRIF